MLCIWYERHLNTHARLLPDDLHTQVGSDDLAATFVGHATILLQWKGLNILTDPNFVPRVIVPKRLVEPGIPIAQLPPLDLIVVSHAHFDHLVKPSLRRLGEGCAGGRARPDWLS